MPLSASKGHGTWHGRGGGQKDCTAEEEERTTAKLPIWKEEDEGLLVQAVHKAECQSNLSIATLPYQRPGPLTFPRMKKY